MELAMDGDRRETIKRKLRSIALLRRQRPSYRETATMVYGNDNPDKAAWLYRDALIVREVQALRRCLEFAALGG